MKTIRVPWIVPLSHSHCFCWWAMGTWQTIWKIGGTMGEYGGGQEIGNRKMCPHGERNVDTEWRQWSSCRKCGMKSWRLATQLNFRGNWKFGYGKREAFNTNPQKYAHSHVGITLFVRKLIVVFFNLSHVLHMEVSTLDHLAHQGNTMQRQRAMSNIGNNSFSCPLVGLVHSFFFFTASTQLWMLQKLFSSLDLTAK